jgi:hypothetical protein
LENNGGLAELGKEARMALPLLRSGKVALPKGATHIKVTKSGSGVKVEVVKAKAKAARKARRKK